MPLDIKPFTKKKYVNAVPIGLFREFFEKYKDNIPLDLENLTHESIYEFLLTTGDNSPANMMEDLHKADDMANSTGLDHIKKTAESRGVQIVGRDATGQLDPITPPHLAMLALVKYREIFDSAHDCLNFENVESFEEYAGLDERDVTCNEYRRLAFELAAADYFNSRYKGKYCVVRSCGTDSEIRLIVSHGKHLRCTTVIQNEKETPITFRDLKEDCLTYDIASGKLGVSASIQEEKDALAGMFAQYIVGKADFFSHAGCHDLYSLDPIKQAGLDFKFNFEWDPDVSDVRVVELQYNTTRRRGEHVTVKEYDVFKRLKEYEHVDLAKAALNYAILRFVFNGGGRSKEKVVKLKPPGVLSFDRRKYEKKIIEHLKRNGFCKERTYAPVSA